MNINRFFIGSYPRKPSSDDAGDPKSAQPPSGFGRWLRLLLLLVLFFAMGHFAGAFQKDQDTLRFQSITAEKLEIRGPDGKLKATLSGGRAGGDSLSFYDAQGARRLSLGIDKEGSPNVLFFDDKRKMRLALAIDPHDNTPHINFFDDQTKSVLSAGLLNGLGPDISVGKHDGNHITISLVNDDPRIQFVDSNHQSRVHIGMIDKQPSISLAGENGAIQSNWRIEPDGSVVFSMSDRAMRQRVVITTDKDGKPSIRVINPDQDQAKTL